jgi:RNA polymerase sigma factor (sigma-70 family)
MGTLIEELMKGYADLRRVLRRSLNADDAADIAQSSFELALRYAQKNEVTAPASLVFSISRHLQIDAARRRQRIKEESLSEEQQHEQIAVCHVTPERQRAAQQHIELLSKTLDDLAPRCREAFVLCKIQGLSYEQAAVEMGISLTVVKKYLGQAMKACRSALL